jgi:hypothetical protein
MDPEFERFLKLSLEGRPFPWYALRTKLEEPVLPLCAAVYPRRQAAWEAIHDLLQEERT